MRRSGLDILLDPPSRAHIALVYDKLEERDAIAADYINQGLRKGELCVYASISMREKQHIKAIASRIKNYDDEIKGGNLLVVDLAPLYLYAVMDDVKLLDDMKQLFAQKISRQKSKSFRFVGDAAAALFENGEFDPCAMVEQWWSQNLETGSCLCPYPKTSLQSKDNNNCYHHIQFARAVRSTHDFVIDSLGEIVYESKSRKQQGHKGRYDSAALVTPDNISGEDKMQN